MKTWSKDLGTLPVASWRRVRTLRPAPPLVGMDCFFSLKSDAFHASFSPLVPSLSSSPQCKRRCSSFGQLPLLLGGGGGSLLPLCLVEVFNKAEAKSGSPLCLDSILFNVKLRPVLSSWLLSLLISWPSRIITEVERNLFNVNCGFFFFVGLFSPHPNFILFFKFFSSNCPCEISFLGGCPFKVSLFFFSLWRTLIKCFIKAMCS